MKDKIASETPLTSVFAFTKYVVALFGNLSIFSRVTLRPVLLVAVTLLIFPLLDTNLNILVYWLDDNVSKYLSVLL